MRLRPVFHVTGPSGGGKTAFVERMLAADLAMMTCARGVRDADARRPVASSSALHPEVRRYQAAGAGTAMVYRFAEPATFAFFESEPMQEYSEAVVIEGDDPARVPDLTVFVAAPLPPGRSLLVRTSPGPDLADPEVRARVEAMLEQPDALDSLLREALGDWMAALAEKVPTIKQKFRARVYDALDNPPPAPEREWRWALVPEYAGLEHAGLVVLNARSDVDRRAAEPLLAEIASLRKDQEIYRDVIRIGDRRPITAVVADLSDPKDPGLRKALAKIKRVLVRESM